ncbi:hypothetical protein [Luteimonas sp. A482]
MEPLPVASIIKNPIQVEIALAQLFGLTLAEIEEVPKACLGAFSNVSALHPKGYNGTAAWADGSAMMRTLQIPKGWKPEDPSNQPRVVSGDGRVAITVSSGDPHTGIETRDPQTRNDKGAQTALSVAINPRQTTISFPDDETHEPSKVVPFRRRDESLWVLLYYIDLDFQEVRYELSLPFAMAENDKISKWTQRLIMPAYRFGPNSDHSDSDDLSDIEITVSPKQS